MVKCEVCNIKEALYRCPKTAVRYCSLACYKNIKQPLVEEPAKVADGETGQKAEIQVVKLEKYQFALEDGRIRELLRHNTVKFHLDKVYRILKLGPVGGSEGTLTAEMKRDLAVDYLNTLRTGGIHSNEAIEEFCQVFLELLRSRT